MNFVHRGGHDSNVYYVYILKSLKNGRFYTGYTRDLNKRINKHNLGKTKGNRYYGPFELVYKEEYADSKEARVREYYIKSQKSKRFIEKLIARGVAQFG